MSERVNFFLEKTLGKDFLESLSKFELYKEGTRTTVDHEELRTALQIVPRAIMSFLIKEVMPMAIGENKEILLPVQENAVLHVSKLERDVYSGHIDSENKKLSEFKYRALPGIGLIIMSTFELYDANKLVEESKSDELLENKIQKLVNDRFKLHDLINQVIDKKMSEKDAVNKLFLEHLTNLNSIKEENKKNDIVPTKKGSEKLKKFIEDRNNKNKNSHEFVIKLSKNEQVSCPDCGKNIFDGVAFSGCICLGQDMDSKIYIKKSEDEFKIRFGKRWDKENIEMLLDILRKKNG